MGTDYFTVRQMQNFPKLRASADGCDYGSNYILNSNFTKALSRYLGQVEIYPDSYITLHIRRGDAKKECDTEIPAMHDYLKCSLSNCSHNFPILVFSDEAHGRDYWTKLEALLNTDYPN